jgi:hypothetical protein
VSTSLARLGSTPEDYARIGIQPDHVLAWEDGARTDGRAGTYEWWYFDARLDDGAQLVVVFFTKSFTDISRPLAPMIRIDLDLPDGWSQEVGGQADAIRRSLPALHRRAAHRAPTLRYRRRQLHRLRHLGAHVPRQDQRTGGQPQAGRRCRDSAASVIALAPTSQTQARPARLMSPLLSNIQAVLGSLECERKAR